MSDPVSNTEIEDVLSSIRRLISESKASEGQQKPKKAEKLVLTPAFRVHDEDSAAQASQGEGDTSSTRPTGETEASKGAVVHAKPKDDIGAAHPAETDSSPELVNEDLDDDTPTPVFSHRGYGATSQDDIQVAFEDIGTSDSDSMTGRAAEIEEAISNKPESWEPDGGEDTNQSDVLMFHAARLQADGNTHEATNDNASNSASDGSEAPFIAIDEPAASATHRVDHAHLVPSSTPSNEVEIVGDDTELIDEEIIHAMVARLVREELQGEVGEKITQAVRRFVRREIEKALTLKGLE